MEHEITTVPLVKATSGLGCSRPKSGKIAVTENDPAITAMTDFTEITPITIESDASLFSALEVMKTHGIRLLLVEDGEEHIVGVITAYDIQSEKPVQYSAENNIAVNDIQVSMLMTPLEETPAFDFNFVKQALLRHVIQTMKELDRPHTLVIETNDGQHIRGVFSTSNISKLLGRPVYQPLQMAQSFAEIHQEIGSDH